MVETFFNYLDKLLDKEGVIVHKGNLVDASIVEVPIQRNSRDENKQLKDGEIPDDWSENKMRQKDLDAKWVKHDGKSHFSYKTTLKLIAKQNLSPDISLPQPMSTTAKCWMNL